MKKYIYESMINYLSNCYSDRYGQLKTIDIYSVFKDKTEECLKYILKNNLIQINTYGYTYGTYKGIGGIHAINDKKLKELCEQAWKENKHRKQSLNSW